MITHRRSLIALISFALILYLMFSYSNLFPMVILGFIVPLSILTHRESEISFVMMFIAFISSSAAIKLNNSDPLQAISILMSVIVFYAIKRGIEKKEVSKIEMAEMIKERYKKEISNIETDIDFYKDYIEKKQRLIDQRKRLLFFLKEIGDSTTEDDTISHLIKTVKILYPEAHSSFIVSPYVSSPVEDIFRTKIPLFIPSTLKETRYPKNIWSEKEKSVIMIPLVVSSKTIAVLSISSPVENYFTKDDFIILEIISNAAATTIENIYLYRNLDSLARKDPLTEVFTRRVFEEKIEEEMLVFARTKQPFCLFLMDIDHFKRINDTYGHQAGDEVLKQVAKTARRCLREFDFIARYGGEEFAIIMPNTSKEEAIPILIDLADEIKKIRFSFSDRNLQVTISGGVGEYPSEGHSKTQIIRVCDERLYRAKNLGRDRIVYE